MDASRFDIGKLLEDVGKVGHGVEPVLFCRFDNAMWVEEAPRGASAPVATGHEVFPHPATPTLSPLGETTE